MYKNIDTANPECDKFPDCPHCGEELEESVIDNGVKHKEKSCPECDYGWIRALYSVKVDPITGK